MATYVKYQTFAGDLVGKVHDLLGTAGTTADTLKLMLSNAAPNVATHTVRADVTELATAGGYTSGGQSCQNVATTTTGTVTLVCTDITWNFTGAVTFRYVIMYNDTPTSPVDPLVSYWDYGSGITTANGDTFLADFGSNTFTLA